MTLVDSGPLVALIDRGDAHHSRCMQALSALPFKPFVTTWPCWTEAMHLLGRSGGARYQAELWHTWTIGRVIIQTPVPREVERMRDLMAQYANVPMDLADASIIAVAESEAYTQVFSLDSDFRIYRLADGGFLRVIP